jgi:carbamoyltransferase
MSVSDIYVGTKFIGHDSAVFIIDPSQKEIWGMSTERTTRYKHDVLSPEDVFTLYKKHNKERVKKIKTIHIGHSFTTVGLKITKDYYFFHKNFRKHFKVFFKKDVEKKLSEFKKMNIIHKISSLISSINGLALIGLFVTNKIVGQKKITVEKKLTKICKKIFPYAKVKFSTYDHETCHAISSHYTSPFEDEILFSSDGFGDGDFSKVFKANKGKIEKIAESKYVEIELNSGPQKTKLVCSPGKIYSRFTSLLGFEENADEGKVEALAAYGEPIQNLLSDLNNAFSIGKDGALKANQAIIKQICDHENATKIIEKHTKEQISATVQKFLENLTERYLNNLKQTTNINAISLSGGVAANVINNLMIFEKICDKMHVVPAFGDDGSAQGASIMAMIADGFEYNELGWMKNKMPYYGTKYNKNSILNSIRKHSKKNQS